MTPTEKDVDIEVREKAEYVAPQLVRIADIARSTENHMAGVQADGTSLFS